MKLFGRLKIYLIGPDLPIEKLGKDLKLVDDQQFILECADEEKQPKEKSKKGKPNVSRDKQRENARKTFFKFFNSSCENVEGSYLTVNDLYKAYTDWLQTHKAGMPINRETMAKYLLKFKKMRTLHSKSLKEFYSFYTDIGIKNSQVPMQKAVLGEIYRFYKLHAVHDFNCMDKIPLDAIYAFYLNWCKSEGNTPIHFHGFSKNTRMLLGNKHLIYKGTNSKGNMRRCLYGYKFFKPLAK